MKYNTMQKVLPGNINFFVSLISIFAVSISMIVSVVFWSTLANTLYAMLLMGSIGLILDATKLCSLYYLAKSTINSKAIIFIASLLIYMLLGFVSIVASTGLCCIKILVEQIFMLLGGMGKHPRLQANTSV